MPIIVLLLLSLLPAPLRAQEPDPSNTVTVTGTATVRREPDRAVLLLAVESFAPNAKDAAQANAERMDALIAALRRLGLTEDQVRTISYTLNPEYDFDRGPEPRRAGEDRLIGYRARNMVEVTIDDVSRVGEVIDAAIEAGANRVDGLSFQLRDPDAARRDALALAVDKARAEAETIAHALGRRLGPAIAVTTGAPPIPFDRMYRMEAAVSRATPTPIEPGTLEVSASVTVVYRLEPPQ